MFACRKGSIEGLLSFLSSKPGHCRKSYVRKRSRALLNSVLYVINSMKQAEQGRWAGWRQPSERQ